MGLRKDSPPRRGEAILPVDYRSKPIVMPANLSHHAKDSPLLERSPHDLPPHLPSSSPSLPLGRWIAACSRLLPNALRPQRSPQERAVEASRAASSFHKRLCWRCRPLCCRSQFRRRIVRRRQQPAHRHRADQPQSRAVGAGLPVVFVPVRSRYPRQTDHGQRE